MENYAGQTTKAWESLLQCLPTRNADMDWWWQLTGRHLAVLVDAAGYPIEKQYEALLMHYHWTSPHMGPAPRLNGDPIKWKSQLQLDGTPMEYAWKWNSQTTGVDIRYQIEPISDFAGTGLDPLNQQATRELQFRLMENLPSLDLTWTNHFLATLYNQDNSKYIREAKTAAPLCTSLLTAVQLLKDGPRLKTYFQPRSEEGGLVSVSHWEKAISQLDLHNPARSALHEFLTSVEGKLLKPFCLSVDNVDPANSRLKWYFNSPHTNFTAVREIMTPGQRFRTLHQESQCANLYELIKAVADLPADFPEDKELPRVPYHDPTAKDIFAELPEMLYGNVYFFDVAPGMELPDIKLYIPVRNYRRDDLSAARGLTAWLEARGRGANCQGYLNMLNKVAEHRHLHEAQGIQTFLSCIFKKNGELELTSYLSPEAFHPGRLKQRRSTRQRGD